jgi:hypothetical protein
MIGNYFNLVAVLRRTISILFALVFLFNYTIYYFVYEVLQYYQHREVRSYIENNISDEEVEKIVISDSLMRTSSSHFRIRNEHEIIYRGENYEIINIEKKQNSTVFYCFHDREGEELIEEMSEHLNRNTEQGTPPARKESNLFSKNVIKEALSEYYRKADCSEIQNVFYFQQDYLLLDPFMPVISPPPKA